MAARRGARSSPGSGRLGGLSRRGPRAPDPGPHGYPSGCGGSLPAGRAKLMGMSVAATGTGKPFASGHTLLSARELQALPASPARLKALILRGSTAGAQSYIFQVTPSLLTLP